VTKPARTFPPLLAACAVALLLAGCGVKAQSDSSSDTTLPKVDIPSTTSARTETTEGTTDTTEPEETTTTRASTPTTRSGSGTTLPAGLEDTFRDQLEQGFKTAGLTDAQAKCLADGYLEKYGTDVGSSSDTTKMLSLFTECGVTPSDLGGLGSGG